MASALITSVFLAPVMSVRADEPEPDWPLCTDSLNIPARPIVESELEPGDVHVAADDADLESEGIKDKGYRVFATARKKTDVDILIAEGFESVQLDLANSASIRSAFATIMEKSGGEIYALFNNGAYGQLGAVEDLSRDVLRQQFEVNLFGAHELTNLVLPVMRKQGYGRIIQNSSVLGFLAFQCM